MSTALGSALLFGLEINRPRNQSTSQSFDLEINQGNYESILESSSPLYKRSTRPNACLCFHSSLLYEYTIYTSQLNSLMGISPPVSSWQIPPVSRQILCEYDSQKVHFYVHPIRRLVPRSTFRLSRVERCQPVCKAPPPSRAEWIGSFQ